MLFPLSPSLHAITLRTRQTRDSSANSHRSAESSCWAIRLAIGFSFPATVPVSKPKLFTRAIYCFAKTLALAEFPHPGGSGGIDRAGGNRANFSTPTARDGDLRVYFVADDVVKSDRYQLSLDI